MKCLESKKKELETDYRSYMMRFRSSRDESSCGILNAL